MKGKFSWQEGYGAFSYSHSHIERVYDYILNQEEHHKKKTFKKEYLEFLKKFEVEYDEKYLFEWYDSIISVTLRGLVLTSYHLSYNHYTPSGLKMKTK